MPRSQHVSEVSRRNHLHATEDKTRHVFPLDEKQRPGSACKYHSFPSLRGSRHKFPPLHAECESAQTRTDSSARTTAKSQAKKSAHDQQYLHPSASLSGQARPCGAQRLIRRAENS